VAITGEPGRGQRKARCSNSFMYVAIGVDGPAVLISMLHALVNQQFLSMARPAGGSRSALVIYLLLGTVAVDPVLLAAQGCAPMSSAASSPVVKNAERACSLSLTTLSISRRPDRLRPDESAGPLQLAAVHRVCR